MEHKRIHIIAFNIPYPPTYGGVIDVFYKIKALHAAGIKIHLHCFVYGRTPHEELNKLCEEISYYPRKAMWQGFFFDKPFIVSSRRNKKLFERLLKDNAPILFEGLHTCFYLDHFQLKNKLKILRMHNDESTYYLKLAEREKKFFKKLYFYEEYKRLLKYEQVLKETDKIFCIAKHEQAYFEQRFRNVNYLAPFHGNVDVTSQIGRGKEALYHGDLSVNENEQAAQFLINEIFTEPSIPLRIAGNHPSSALKKLASNKPHITLIENPANEQLSEWMANAHVHILPAFQATGIKLKLIQALFRGRFCLVNSLMTEGTGLDKFCTIADQPDEMKAQLRLLFQKEFTEDDLVFRKQIELSFSDKEEIKKLIRLL